MGMQKKHVVGVDPGRRKCGIAVMGIPGGCILRRVTPVEVFASVFSQIVSEYRPDVVVLGDRTGAETFKEQLRQIARTVEHPFVIEMVSEHHSSEEGRLRYLCEHRRGWRRLVPLGLQWPNEPYDDYVAEVLALRYLHDESVPENP